MSKSEPHSINPPERSSTICVQLDFTKETQQLLSAPDHDLVSFELNWVTGRLPLVLWGFSDSITAFKEAEDFPLRLNPQHTRVNVSAIQPKEIKAAANATALMTAGISFHLKIASTNPA
jgi:hypothetical protein